MSETKKLLVVAYYFPPMGGIPVQRTLRFVKHLSSFNWNPVILTVKDGVDHFHPNDPELMRKVPEGLSIYRAREFSFTAKAIKFCRDRFSGRGKKKNTETQEGKTDTVGRFRSFLYNTVWFPDEKSSWISDALTEGRRAIKEQGIDVIYATGYPWSAFIVAYRLSLEFDIPFVVDYRDSWTLNQRLFWNNDFQRSWERKILSQATRMIFVSDIMREEHMELYPHLDPKRMEVITNGFDAEDYEGGGTKGVEKDKLVITYTGTCNDNVPPADIDRSPYYFLLAVAKLVKENPDLRKELLIRFVGSFGDNHLRLVKELDIHDLLDITGTVTHADSVAYQKGTDVLLLIIAPCKGSRNALTGKLFEYIAAGKPILSLLPEGAAKALIDEKKLGPTVHTNDTEGIANAIKDLFQQWKEGGGEFKGTEKGTEEFESRNLTKRFAEVLTDAHNDPMVR